MSVTLVQSLISPYNSNESTNEPATFPSNVTAGNLLIVCGSAQHADSVLAISDTQGNTYTQAFLQYDAASIKFSIIYWAIAKATGANTVTLSATQQFSEGFPEFCLIEASSTTGWPTNPFDCAAAASSTTATLSSGSITPSSDGELIIGFQAAMSTQSNGTLDSPWAAKNPGFIDVSNCVGVAEYLIQETAAPIAATATLSKAPLSSQLMSVAAFKPVPPDTRITPTITWPTPAAIMVGTALSSTQLNASANVPGSFVYTPASGTIEASAGTVTLTATFTPTDTITYRSVTTTVQLTVSPDLGSNSYWRTITVPASSVTADQVNFPVMIAGTFPEWKSTAYAGHIASDDAHTPFDLVFWQDSSFTTKLPFEISYWNPATGDIEAFVLLPSLSATVDTVFYATWGNNSITTSQADAATLWKNGGYSAVFHFGSSPDGTVIDSTGNGYNGTLLSGATQNNTDSFNGTSNSLEATLTTQGQSVQFPGFFGNPSELTLELWTKLVGEGYYGSFNINLGGYAYISGPGGDGVTAIVFGARDAANNLSTTNDWAGVTLGDWVHFAFSLAPGAQTGFQNGAAQAGMSNVTTPSWSGDSQDPNSYLGVATDGSAPWAYAMTGSFDEFRVSSVARSPEWIAAQYACQKSPSTFLTLGTEQSSVQTHSYTVTTSDTFTLSDFCTVGSTHTFRDIIPVAEAINRAVRKQALDALTPVDSVSRAAHTSSADHLTVTDSIHRVVTKISADAITMADSVARFVRKTATDAITMVDTITRSTRVSASDVLTMADSAARSVGVKVADSLSMVDSVITIIHTAADAVRKFVVEAWQRLWLVPTLNRTWSVEATPRTWTVEEGIMISTTKSPEAIEDFELDWSAAVANDSIVSSTWTSSSPDITVVQSTNTATSTVVRLAGGQLNKHYTVINKVTLGSGQVKTDALLISVTQ